MGLPTQSTCVRLDLTIDIDLLAAFGITLPGGADLQAMFAIGEVPNVGDLVSKLLAQLNAALAPMVPVFRIIEAVIQVFKCLQAVVDSLLPPDPTQLIKCLAKLALKIDFLLQLIPQVSIPLFIKAVVDLLIAALVELRAQLEAVIALQVRIDAGKARAIELNAGLMAESLECIQANLDLQFEAVAKAVTPLNIFIGLLNIFMELGGLDPIPLIEDLHASGSAEAALAPLDVSIEVLQGVSAGLPG